MKKLLFALVAILAFVGCEKEDGGNDNHLLVGKWECVEEYVKEGDEWVATPQYGTRIWIFDGEYFSEHQDSGSWVEVPYTYSASKKELLAGVFGIIPIELSADEMVTYTEFDDWDDDLKKYTEEHKSVFRRIE